MNTHDYIASAEEAFFAEIHMAIQEGTGIYQCTVPEGVGIMAAAYGVSRFFPEVGSIDMNLEDGILLLTTVGRLTIQ